LSHRGKRSKIITLVALLVVIGVALVVLGTIKFLDVTHEQALEEFRNCQMILAGQVGACISQSFSSLLAEMSEVALLACGPDKDTEHMRAALERLCTREGCRLTVAAVADSTGAITLWYSDNSFAQSAGICPENIINNIRRNDRKPLTVVKGLESVFVAVPITPEDEVDGAIVGMVDCASLREGSLAELAQTPDGEAFLFDEKGTLVTRQSFDFVSEKPDAAHLSEGQSLISPPLTAEMSLGKKGFCSCEHIETRDGKEIRRDMLVAYAPVSAAGKTWSVAIASPRSNSTGYLVRSPWTIASFASSRIVAIFATVGLVYMLNKRRRAADDETKRLLEGQKVLKQLEESEERYRILVENLLSPVIIFQDSRIRFANRMFYAISGYTPEEVASKDFDMFGLVHEDDRQNAMENAAKVLSGERLSDPREMRFVKKSGDVLIGLTFSSLIHYDGKPAIETVIVDITRIKRMERELNSTKERLQYLLDTAPVMIFQLDAKGNFLYANRETLRVTGYQRKEWLGKSFVPIIHPDDLSLAVSKFEEGRKGSNRREYKLRIRNASGELRILEINAHTVLADGEFAGALLIARDITEQQRLQQDLKEARYHLANIIENAGDAIITLDAEGCVVSWNKSAESMFRFTTIDIIGKPLCSLFETNSGELSEVLSSVAQGATIRDHEIEHVFKDGTRLAGLFAFSPIRDITGKVAGISCFAKNITERRRLEKQLEMDKQFIDQLIENANALIAVINDKRKLIVFNKCFEQVTGFTKEEVLGKDPLQLLVPEEFHATVSAKVRDVSAEEPVHGFEVPIISKTSKTLTVLWNAAEVKLPTGQAATIVVGQDMTEQKRMYEELIQSKKLASIGELVSGVAHELNNPLTVVMGYSQLLTAEQALSGKQREMAQKVLDAAGRSKRIVENLLAFARKKQIQKQKVDINEILDNALSLREHNFTVNNVDIVRRYDEKLPPTFADAHQLQQVFLNLINNAFDAMYDAHRGGRLEVKSYRRDHLILVEVSDDGPGVPEAAQEKIFDPFFTTKEVGKGTGLGMSLSYGIVKEHGGNVYLDKTYRAGARFIVEIPLIDAPPNATAESNHAAM